MSSSDSSSTDLIISNEPDIEQTSVTSPLNNTITTTTSNISSPENGVTTEVLTNNIPVETAIPAQVAQWVYIQPPQKLNFPISTSNKTVPNNLIVNTIPQFQISSIGNNIANITNKNANITQGITIPANIAIPATQNVILTQSVNSAVKSKHLVIQKPGTMQAVPVVPVSVSNTSVKNALAYFTMIKPNEPQTILPSSRIQVTPIGKIKSAENIQIIVTSNSDLSNCVMSSNQKYVIAPMPKITSNRLPITATTNSVQPKITYVPLPVTNNVNSNKPKIFNLKIADGHIQSENNGAITIMCDTIDKDEENDKTKWSSFKHEEQAREKFVCEEVINLDSPKVKLEEKSYELSITENSTSQHDVSFTVTVPDETLNSKLIIENKSLLKEPQKYPKHGVSILKKNFNYLDRKSDKGQNSLIISAIPNCITTISDAKTKEVKITTSSSIADEDTVIVRETKAAPQKTERRRKSHFSYRKDYDEIIVMSDNAWDNSKPSNNDKFKQYSSVDITVTKLSNDNSNSSKDIKHNVEDFVEIELVQDKADINMNENYDIHKVLNWEDGIGTLPGSDLKFQMNEFGLLEFITKDEYKQIINKKLTKVKDFKCKDDFQEEMRCLICGCYGMPSEFISPKYCSGDCQDVANKAQKEKEAKARRRKKRNLLKKPDEIAPKDTENVKIDREPTPSDEENTSNENSQDRFTYPWNCTKKGFSWAKYLDHIKAKAAPVKLFKDPFPYNRNGFRPGMKLEGVDPQHPSYFCVLTVAEAIGYRVRLHFDGYPDNYDFWINADSMDIFPIGWCEKYGHVLHPPPGITIEDFNWTTYLKLTKSSPAPRHLFTNRAGNAICPNGFRVGMKLEAVDRKNNALVCVASVRDMMDNRILVHFDSWDDIYDYWADPMSPYIHPVGWCDEFGHFLTPPNGYPNPETFTWERYLKETKTIAAPVRAFKQRPTCGFKRGMRLECVDKRVPQLIRVATVDDIRDHQIRICFDGWPDRYSYWVDDDNYDIHPVGWCQKTGHPIEPPLTPDDVYDFLECPTVGCRGQGHVKGPVFARHSTQKHCPYADENMDQERSLPDRLLSPDRQLEAVVPLSREPKEKVEKLKGKQGRPPKVPRLEPMKAPEWIEDDEDKKPLKRKYRKQKNCSPEFNKQDAISLFTFPDPVAEQIWNKHSQHLKRYINGEIDPRDWDENDVVDFLASVPSVRDKGDLFVQHKIDGEALLMLTQQDLIDILNIKLGPAIKLYNTILLLRRSVRSVM